MPVKKESGRRKTKKTPSTKTLSANASEFVFLDAIIEHIPLMIFVKDAKELRFVKFNKAGEDLLGIPRKKMMGKNDYDFFPEEQADFFTKKDKAVLRKKDVVDVPEEEIDTKHGKRLLHTKKVAICDEKGRAKYLLGISQDITEQEALMRRLDESRQILEKTFEEAPIGIALVSPGGNWLRVNKRLVGMFGYSEMVLLKKTWQEITHPDDLEADLALVKDVLEGKRDTYQMEKRFFRKDKTIMWVRLSVSLVKNDDGTPRHFVSHLEDISEQKAQEEALQEKIEELEKMNDMMVHREEKMIELKEQLGKLT